MAAQHLAAICIQNLVRRFLFKKKIEIIRNAKREGQRPPFYILHPSYRSKAGLRLNATGGGNAGHSASQSLRQKFLTSPFNIMTKNEDRCMQDFCAALI